MSAAPFVPERLLARWRDWPPPTRLWIAYSGGLDSHVLLHACATVRAQLPAPLAAIHINHGLHPDAPRWAAHCQQVCAALGIALEVCAVHVNERAAQGREAAARAARYAAWRALLAPGEQLATAHQRDDQAETLLLALLRGSGVHGLAAMPASAPLGAGLLVRPLLDQSRAALADYARAHGLLWIEDPSNQDLTLERNFLRQQVMPLLTARWPAAARVVARTAAHCAEAALLIDRLSDARRADLTGTRSGTLSLAGLRRLDLPLRRAVLRRWLAHAGFAPPRAPLLARIADEMLAARADAQPCVRWPGCEIRRYRDDLHALVPLPPPPRAALAWDGRAPLVLPPGLGTLWAQPPADAPQCWQVRFGATGARCRPRADGPSRALKQWFQEHAIPAWLRPYVPLVFTAQGTLLGIGGLSVCAAFAPRFQWRDHPWHTLLAPLRVSC